MAFCTDCGREVDEDSGYCSGCGRKLSRLMNVIDVTSPDTYDIKDANGMIIGHTYGQHSTRDLNMERCEICRREIAKDTKYCPSCGAYKLPDRYVFEGTDGTLQGEIHLNRFVGKGIFGIDLGNIIPKLGGYLVPKLEIYDAQKQLRAILFNDARLGETESIRIDNPQGRNLARIFFKFLLNHPTNDYEILTPARDRKSTRLNSSHTT